MASSSLSTNNSSSSTPTHVNLNTIVTSNTTTTPSTTTTTTTTTLSSTPSSSSFLPTSHAQPLSLAPPLPSLLLKPANISPSYKFHLYMAVSGEDEHEHFEPIPSLQGLTDLQSEMTRLFNDTLKKSAEVESHVTSLQKWWLKRMETLPLPKPPPPLPTTTVHRRRRYLP
ncbi:hypothetical protein HMI54_003489 [Coelomomyces lativittatus]|nr:hypothetical protein HMI54_003489 [Coelomomyces lativittatus]